MGCWMTWASGSEALSEVEISGIYQNGLAGKPLNEEFEPLNIKADLLE